MSFFLSTETKTTPRRRGAHRLTGRSILAGLAISTAIALSGCATVPKSVYSVDPESLLEEKPQIYAQMSGDSLRQIAKVAKEKDIENLFAAVLASNIDKAQNGASGGDFSQASQNSGSKPKINTDQVMSFLDKAAKVGIGLDGFSDGSISGEAVVLGDYPVMPLRMALATSGDWKSVKTGYSNNNAELFLRTPQPGILHFSTLPEPPDRNPYSASSLPDKFASLKSKDILIWVDKPARLLGWNLVPDGFDLPIAGVVFSASRVNAAVIDQTSGSAQTQGAGADPLYDVDIYVSMKDPSSAAAFRPIVRFLWTGLVEKVFTSDKSAALDKPIDLEGDTYSVKGIRMPISSLCGAILKMTGSK